MILKGRKEEGEGEEEEGGLGSQYYWVVLLSSTHHKIIVTQISGYITYTTTRARTHTHGRVFRLMFPLVDKHITKTRLSFCHVWGFEETCSDNRIQHNQVIHSTQNNDIHFTSKGGIKAWPLLTSLLDTYVFYVFLLILLFAISFPVEHHTKLDIFNLSSSHSSVFCVLVIIAFLFSPFPL